MLPTVENLNRFKKRLPVFFMESRFSLLLSLFAGSLTVLAFAPFKQVWLIYILIAYIFYVWSISSAKKSLLHGWLFGLGMQFTGVGWIFLVCTIMVEVLYFLRCC